MQHDGVKRGINPRFRKMAWFGVLPDGQVIHKAFKDFTQLELQLALQSGSKRMREIITGSMPEPYQKDNKQGEPLPKLNNNKSNGGRNKKANKQAKTEEQTEDTTEE